MQQDNNEIQLKKNDDRPFSEKFAHLIDPRPSTWLEDAQWRQDNENWLRKSFNIALNILSELEKQKLTKHDLVNRTGLPTEAINKILKGSENLDLKTISLLEEAFDEKVDLLKLKIEE